jgi:hypothetical protein
MTTGFRLLASGIVRQRGRRVVVWSLDQSARPRRVPREWRVSSLDHLLSVTRVSFITWNLTTGVDEGWTTTEVKAPRMTIIAFCLSWVRIR